MSAEGMIARKRGKRQKWVERGRQREREEVDNEEEAIVWLPGFDQRSMGSGAESRSTAPGSEPHIPLGLSSLLQNHFSSFRPEQL